MKIPTYLKERYAKKGKFGLAGDIVFILLILVMLIPSWRRDVGSLLVKPFMRSPSATIEEKIPLLQSDFEMTFISLDKHRFQLSDFTEKPIFLTWWATWCHHCVAELSQLQQLSNNSSSDAHILILTNEDPAHVKQFLESRGYSIPIYVVTGYNGGNLNANSLPTSFVIDKSGTIVYKKTGATKWGSDEFGLFLRGL
ncbi:MAG: TlpA disulfide reductase family protein [Salinivirgaceae bacterium]|nr:TlpA disulfide reductase family protein [Salinivirgaceae bacterium]MDD4747413.1 TlpA disulfide reductase family protein [Salinivirgaceae bacterium]MDY0280220.1 TlpA disulfide reductase family protein [Salinivirgaceae bacterium]